MINETRVLGYVWCYYATLRFSLVDLTLIHYVLR